MQAYQVQICAGVRFAADGTILSEIERDAALAEIEQVLARMFGGVTFVRASGSWEDDKTGSIIQEPSGLWLAWTGKPDLATSAAEVVKRALRQHMVMVAVVPISLLFV